MQRAYLERIGLNADEIANRKPNVADLELLIQSHLSSVPFESLGLHGFAPVPSLDVDKTLDKIVKQRRGGFCWELNFAFCWLLRSLGYKVRIGSAHVMTPDGPVQGHLVLYVDNFDDPLLVDPGFGDAVRAPVPISGSATDKMIGETLTLAPASEFGAEAGNGLFGAKRFSNVLTRQRACASNTVAPLQPRVDSR